MKRRTFLGHSALSLGAVFLPWPKLLGSIEQDQPVYTMKPLREKVGLFLERGGTIGWMIQKNGIVVVDSQFPEQANHLIAEIRKKTKRKIDLLVNTHHHADHTAGNIAFRDIVKTVVAHKNSRLYQEISAKDRKVENEQLYPDTVYEERWSRKVGGETITLRYFGPAHTSGDTVVHFENSNIVHLGDLVFNRRHAYIDKPAGASIRNWMDVLDRIAGEYDDDTLFIFGHAAENDQVTGGKDDLHAMKNYLGRLLEFVEQGMKNGKTKEELCKASVIPGAEEWQGQGIERVVNAAWEELSTGK
jgi:cyclase